MLGWLTGWAWQLWAGAVLTTMLLITVGVISDAWSQAGETPATRRRLPL